MTLQFPAFLFLACALCSVWARPLPLGRRACRLWLLLLVMAMAWGLVGGVLDPVAISALVVLGGAAYACVPHRAAGCAASTAGDRRAGVGAGHAQAAGL
jgi:hypothetical protein